jgi:hypothetical protein
MHREEGGVNRTLAPHYAHSTARDSVASDGEEACKAARKAGGREGVYEGWVSWCWSMKTDTTVDGGMGRLVQWISRERPKEISNPLEEGGSARLCGRGSGAVCGGASCLAGDYMSL